MKIDEDLRASYERQRQIAELLKQEVDDIIRNTRDVRWHYESRVKGEESFALKVECGRVVNPDAMEDLFGGVLVVPNQSDVHRAETLVTGLFGPPVTRRPPSSQITRKDPADFLYDDLRLYLKYAAPEYNKPSLLDGVEFEIQIRTFLQHAWSIATHDIVYKSDQVSWRRERIAAQAKAALEHVEVAIDSITALEKSNSLPLSSESFESINSIIGIIRDNWDYDQLPVDLRRLAQGIGRLLDYLKIDLGGLRSLLEDGRAQYGGGHNLDWSPYRMILHYLAAQHHAALRGLLRRKRKDRVFVYRETLEALDLPLDEAQGAVVIRPGDPAASGSGEATIAEIQEASGEEPAEES